MKKGLIIVSIILMGVSLLGMVESSRLERTLKMGIGIDFLPFWMSAFIGILAVILLINALRGKIKETDKPLFPRENIPRVIWVAIALLAYLILFETIGYVLSTFLFFMATIFILQRSRMMNIIFYGSLFTFLLFAIFKVWLKSPLPTGFFGI
ncbi:MAG: tripartite tricarboxylate transporter TctB family protein [Deltaproteobacteria bacterium]|jgi:putative tricarboxylic transport membrane protein|nr:tripartite tricarboxylate transporter TctB family protein [Deltaproteobacteria bacterium]